MRCGQWFSKGGGALPMAVRVEPLTVHEICSAAIFWGIRVLPDQKWWRVKRVFIGLFRRYGMPQIIRVDNGGPFGSTGPAGLSRLSAPEWSPVWEIEVEFIRPAHPQDNAAHEQMHRELKAEAARPVSSTPRAQQRRLERWRRYYNLERPHEALGQRTPGRKYRRSSTKYRIPTGRWKYPPSWAVRRVRSNGQIRWQGTAALLIGEAFVGYRIGLRGKSRKESGLFTFSGVLLGEVCAL